MATQTYPVPPPGQTQILNTSQVPINPVTEESFLAFLNTVILNHVRDPNNTRTAPFFNNEIYTGTFTKVNDWASSAVVVVSDQPPASAYVEWSDDGISPVADSITPTTAIEVVLQAGVYVGLLPTNTPFHPYMRVVADYTGITCALSSVFTLLSQDPLPPTILGLDAQIPTFALGSITRAILGGNVTDGLLAPTTTFDNVALTQDRALIIASPGAELFSYAIPPEPPLPSGAPVTIHPILNTEPNTLDTGWIASPSYAGGQEFNLIADQIGVDVFLLNSHDDQGVHMVNDEAPFLSSVAPGVPATLSAAMFGKRYFRAVTVNRSGSTVNKLSLMSFGNQVPTPPIFNSINQTKFDFFPAALNQSALLGRVPGTSLLKLMEITTAGFLNTSASDFLREVSLGRVDKHSVETLTARNLNTPNVFEDIWLLGGSYPYPTSAATLTISSTSILDDLGSTGAEKVVVRGLDANYDEVSEEITLDGLTGVVTANSYLRLLSAKVSSVGSLGTNLGIIDITHGGTAIGRIGIEDQRTQLSQFTVPAGKTALLVYEQASAGIGDDIEVDFMVREGSLASSPFIPRQGIIATEGTTQSSVYVSDPIPEKSDLKWRAKKIGLGLADVSVEYRLLIIDNEVI